MLQMTRNTLFEKMDFGKCYGGDIVQKKLFRPNMPLLSEMKVESGS